jgi:asparagine synthase (glutamine-hydrolysing)
MCGFTIQFNSNYCNENLISHRGEKKVQKRTGHYTMTHFKLPFQTDLDDDFDQPIDLGDGNYLLFNGEIFNYPKEFKNDVDYLKDFFSKKDYLGKLVNGKEYQTWDGFWAIAIVTPYGFLCFTDPLGKKQLYYSKGCLSSEIKPLLEFDIRNTSFDNYNPAANKFTPFSNVQRILPNIIYRSMGDRRLVEVIDNLFDLRMHPGNFDIKSQINKAIESRMINRNGFATLLVSGGLDSSIILDSICRNPNIDESKIELLTIENQDDEKYISILESFYNVNVRRIQMTDPIDMTEVLKAYEYPIEKGSLFPQWLLCKEAQNKVILTGDGSDELFSGYSRALKEDTQDYDVFVELPFYHNIRLDRTGMAFTKEVRSPFMSHDLVRMALNLGYEFRRGKQILKEIYAKNLPKEIIAREKQPLRVEHRVLNKDGYDKTISEVFESIKF